MNQAERMRRWRAGRTTEQLANDRRRGRERAARVYEEKMQFLNELKLYAGCKDCGYREDARALQFDHVNGESRPKRMSSYTTVAAVIRALKDVEVVCANCHCIRTFDRGQNRMRPK